MRVRTILGLTCVVAIPFVLYAVDVQNGNSKNLNTLNNRPLVINNMGAVQTVKVVDDSKTGTSDYRTVEWEQLIPPNELEILSKQPPVNIHDNPSLVDEIQKELEILSKTPADLTEDPSLLARILDKIEITTPFEDEDAYVQAQTSANVIPELDGQLIQIPGFVVPLDFKNKNITQFLLVPYFGACIHVPPPPPNQIILVTFPKGLKERNMNDPIWISGKLSTTLVENDLATSAYSLQAHSYKEYF